MDEEIIWKIIDKYFKSDPNILVSHHLDSYNDFMNNGIKQIFKEKNPIKIIKKQNPITKEFDLRCNLYLGGKNGDKIYIGKPVIYDETREHYMYPNEARLRNMTYGATIHYDVEVEFFIKDGEIITERVITLPDKIYLGKFPIMLNSQLCILNKLSTEVKFNMGECKNDHGGYFIIDGKEKVVVPQEKFADNMLYIRDKVNDLYSHSAEIRTVSEDASKPIRTLSVKIVAPSASYTNKHIVVDIPNVRAPVPLFILMRALGIQSDKDIIKCCLLDMEKYKSYIDLFIPSIHNAGKIFTQETALKYISTFTKNKTISSTLHILSDYFLPNIGELNFISKAYFIGYMTLELLKVYTGEEKPTDRDNFKFKRVELTGSLMYDLFKEYYTLQQKHIFKTIDKEYFYKETTYQGLNFISLIENNYRDIFKERIVEDGFKKGFKGNWGAEEHTKKLGLVQPLNRLSYNSFIAHLRKINLPLDASAKVVGPRLLHSSQWGLIDPLDTPDGGNVGLHKHLAITTKITGNCSGIPVTKWLRNYANLLLLEECNPELLSQTTKVFVNGKWIGNINKPIEIISFMKQARRISMIPIYTSIQYNIEKNELNIFTDSGRLCRPLFYINKDTNKISYDKPVIIEKLKVNDFTWNELISGFYNKEDPNFSINTCKLYENISDLYNITDINELNEYQAIIEYIDSSEAETTLISLDEKKLYNITNELSEINSKGRKKDVKREIPINSRYTHLEIHPSFLLGVLGNQIVFPENNPLPRDLFACGQSKQAISLYNSNYQVRIDKMGVILNYGQIPLVKSRYMKYINNEEHPYGENVVVAIGVYGGYNVEDSILFNEGSIQRGMFRTTYFTMYESYEESSKIGNSKTDSKFTNIHESNVIGLKPGYDYSDLDKYGLIKENSPVDDKKVLIGKVISSIDKPGLFIDNSEMPKKGQLGFVDKSFITEGEEGFRIAKIRIREERQPSIGDKFCSRCGQKGTVGLIIPEIDMPFTADGIKPDIIINPHALPSRMTIGQLIETLVGKACAIYGGFGDCTAFVNKGLKNKKLGELLTLQGFHSSGNQILYNGNTGEQLETEIYIGPNYYMRLKHMVKDKINYRAQGPRTVLTRQTVQGRANDGGLRIGEMERDGIVAHGATKFLEESLMVRGDEYYMAICNQSGTIAIYNESKNLFMSPMADGPIQFTNLTDTTADVVNITRFGREFSIVRIPYAFKLLMQELRTMNIEMRIITEDNVDQLTNMSFSNNYKKLVGDSEIKLSNLIDRYKKLEQIQKEKEEELLEEKKHKKNKLDINERNNKILEKFGWEYYGTNEDGQEIFRSIILDENKIPTDVWNADELGYDPDRYPNGFDENVYDKYNKKYDNRIILSVLASNKIANNMEYVKTYLANFDSNKFFVPISESTKSSPGSESYKQSPNISEPPSGTPPPLPSYQPQTPSGTPPPLPSYQPQTPSGTPPPLSPLYQPVVFTPPQTESTSQIGIVQQGSLPQNIVYVPQTSFQPVQNIQYQPVVSSQEVSPPFQITPPELIGKEETLVEVNPQPENDSILLNIEEEKGEEEKKEEEKKKIIL